MYEHDIQAYIEIELSEQILLQLQLNCFEPGKEKLEIELWILRESPPFRSLEDEYGTISGLFHRYPSRSELHGWFLPPWYQTWLVCYLIRKEVQLWNDVSILAQNLAMELSFVRFQEARWSRAQVLKAKATNLLELLVNSTRRRLWNKPKFRSW